MSVTASQNWEANLEKAATAPRKSGTAHFNPLPSLALSLDGVYDIQYLEKRLRFAWKATKKSPFFIRLRCSRSDLRFIDGTVSWGIFSRSQWHQSSSESKVPLVPKMGYSFPSGLKGFLVLQLSLVPLGCPVDFALDKLEKADRCFQRRNYSAAKYYVIRDLVAIANGMEATSEYPRDWLEPQDTKVSKRKASVDVDEANKRTKTDNIGAGKEMDSENPLEVHDQNRGETGSEGDANTGTDTGCDTSSDTSSEESVESVKSELNLQDVPARYARMTQPRGFRLMQYFRTPCTPDEREKMIEAILNITEKPTDADLKAKMPARLVLTGDQNEEFLMRMYDARKRKIEQEHSHAIMTHGERVRIAAVVRRVYQSLDHTVGHLDWNCRQIESSMREMLDDIATMRKEIKTLRSENVDFRAEIQLLKAATESS